MSLRAGDYRPRNAEDTVLYRVIDEHLGAFLETAGRHAGGASLPAFVEQEFRDFLTCGVLTHGFARLRCTDCALERRVAFSCKGRGFCPSCGGRRMAKGAGRLVDGVLPRVPVRQWVLSLPYRLRYLLAWDHGLARAVLGVTVRVLLGFQRRRARRYGIRAGRSGSVTVIQRSRSGPCRRPSSRSRCWRSWRRWSRGRGSIWCSTMACWRRTAAGARGWWATARRRWRARVPRRRSHRRQPRATGRGRR